MEASGRTVRVYETPDGRTPFEEWIEGLRDNRAIARIEARIERLTVGNFGDCKSVGEGVRELRVDYGPGYRVYFGLDGPVLVILLCGGDKRSQRKDIRRAKEYWQEYKDAHKRLP